MSVEALGRRRRQVLSAFLVAWSIWWATRIVNDVAHGGRLLSALSEGVLLLVQTVSYLGFVIALFRFCSLNRHLRRHPVLAATLNDELTQQVWLQALKIGFGCTLACQLLLTSAAAVYPPLRLISATLWASITTLVGVSSCLAAFLWMERE